MRSIESNFLLIYLTQYLLHMLIYMVIGGDDEDLKILWGSNFFRRITPCLSGKTFEIYSLSLRFSSRVSLIWYLERDFLYLGQLNKMFISISKQRISKSKRGHNFDFRSKFKYLCIYI